MGPALSKKRTARLPNGVVHAICVRRPASTFASDDARKTACFVKRFAKPAQGPFQKALVVARSLDQRGCFMLSHLSRFVTDFISKEDGPTAVEYAVMLALIIVVCIGAITTLGQNANTTFTSVGTAIGSTSS
jgi:pilus assembly protein Flp/PilA